ncbi:MAG TPA: hypothetical protein VFF81_14415 [Noviherbaspirillum sp.]|nr:hypothetical protein [Noviherbaspirillum sp.]
MATIIFDKTDKGREEIATRKFQLAPKMRTLLVMIDGKQSSDELLQKIGGLGFTPESINELMANGFIHQVAAIETPVVSGPVPAPGPAPAAAAPTQATANQFQALYHFYTETIKSTIGLRGYSLQLKVEKASSIDELRELREPYLEAVLKAKGKEMAQSVRGRLDELLNA